jgi:hypothetical protein
MTVESEARGAGQGPRLVVRRERESIQDEQQTGRIDLHEALWTNAPDEVLGGHGHLLAIYVYL